MGTVSRSEARKRRQKRVRKRVKGSAERPRLCVFRSSRHIYAQIIDDEAAVTLVDVSSLSKDIRSMIQGKGGCKEGAAIVGEHVARKAVDKGIKKVVFDRNGFLYHGRVQMLAEAAREHGLEF